MSRHTFNKEDRQVEKEVMDSLKVSSYLGHVHEKLTSGKPIPKGMVPNMGTPTAQNLSNETGSIFGLEDSEMFQSAAQMKNVVPGGIDAVPSKSDPAPTQQVPSAPQVTISKRQWRALQKFPALIEFLGGPNGEKLAHEVIAKVNEMLAVKVGESSRNVNKHAQACQAVQQNIKQFFVGENDSWVCVVTASGPFRGDEAVYYDVESDRSSILRPHDDEWINVTDKFNVVHEVTHNPKGNS